MYTLPKQDYLRRSVAVGHRKPVPVLPLTRKQQVKLELRNLGVSSYGLLKSESRYLPSIIHEGEHLQGVVYGSSPDGSVMIVATDRRLIFLDKKPFFTNVDEISFGVIGGVNLSHAGFGSTVVLHTRIKDYTIRTLNQKCAEGFVHYIEQRCLERNEGFDQEYSNY